MWSRVWSRLLDGRAVWMTSFTIATVMITVNLLGIFQILDWAAYDQFIRLRPSENTDSRIVIVTIDESDLTHLKQWPLSDGVIAQALTIIKAQKPRIIGIDLYRNLTIEPGHQQLLDILESTPNVIGIEKVSGRPVPPSPILNRKGQVALADLVLDADGKVRRALLSIRGNDGKIKLGLGTDLALQYLAKEGIELQHQSPSLQLGKASFLPLQTDDGGYVRADNGGYQILLNYRGIIENFQTIPLEDLLAKRFSPDLMADRIVLIGSVAESLNDNFYTPYSSVLSYFPSRMPGVAVHANIASQIVSAALDGRLLLRTLPNLIEWLWVVFWSFVGAYCSWQLLKHQRRHQPMWELAGWLLGSILLSGGVLVGISYLLFLSGWWLPIISPFFALSFAILCLPGYKNFEWQRLASLDSLTKIANRRNFDEVLAQQWSQHSEKQEAISLILCDVDHFKLYNDTYGHPAGDKCLQEVAQALVQATRTGDLVARYGGEEFVVLLPNTSPEKVAQIAQRLCVNLKARQIPHRASPTCPYVTLSCGWATIIPRKDLNPQSIVNQADAALYQAKKQGRNRAVSYLSS